MFCFSCGIKLPDGSKACGTCGMSFLPGARMAGGVASPGGLSSRVGLRKSAAGDSSSSAGGGREMIGPSGVRFPPGAVLADRFRVERLLGHGGCGEVFMAYDIRENKMIALKVVTFDPVWGPAAYEEVRRELVARDKVNDYANVLRNEGFFTVPDFQGSFLLLMSMEYAPLGSLRRWLLDQRDNVEFRRQCGIELFMQACSGVKALHSRGLVHLDLKPENLMLTGENSGCVLKVADFEISPVAEQRIMNQAFPLPAGWGTYAYKSPEQFTAPRQEEIKATSDVYALGIILFEILDVYGKPPFDGSPQELHGKHVSVTPPKLRGISERVETVVKRCLAKNPNDRYLNADALYIAVQNAYDGMAGRKKVPLSPAAPVLETPSAAPAPAASSAMSTTASPQTTPASTEAPLVPPPPLRTASIMQAVVPPAEPEKFITTGVGLRLRLVPAGEFLMGSPKEGSKDGPQHKVTLTKPFYISTHLVTQTQYEQLMGVNPSYFKWPNRPIETVNWEEAKEFCQRLSDQEGRPVRLPTEAEWEYAARSGVNSNFFWGDQFNGDFCWATTNSGKESHDVGTRLPNPFGLFDMLGNVWEWCEDWYGPYTFSPVVDPRGPENGTNRVLRGGSWSDSPDDCGCANRGRTDPTIRFNVFGFRVVLPLG